MNIRDKARDLAGELTSSKEYKEYLEAKEKLAKNKNNMDLLTDFKRRQWEIQMSHILGQEINDEQIEKTEEIYELLSLNSDINEYLTAEYQLAQLLGDVQKIISDSVDNWLDFNNNNTNILN